MFDLFKVGIGPSSSHTVGPMRAAHSFATRLEREGLLPRTAGVRAELFGSLGATGHGHGSVRAVVLGLKGDQSDLVDSVGARLLGPRGTPLQGLARHLRRPRQLGVTDEDLNIQSNTDRGRGRRRGRVGGAARRHDGAVRG